MRRVDAVGVEIGIRFADAKRNTARAAVFQRNQTYRIAAHRFQRDLLGGVFVVVRVKQEHARRFGVAIARDVYRIRRAQGVNLAVDIGFGGQCGQGADE